jgi:uncharacterized RDD family membrane protein YckC
MGAAEGFFRRLAACVLDSFALSIIVYPIYFVLWLVMAFAMFGAGAGRPPNPDAMAPVFGIMFIAWAVIGVVIFAVSVAYFGGMLSARGQTLGKMAVGLKVAGPDGRNPSFGRALLREIIGKFCSGVVLDLGYLWMLWDPEQQTWHDKIATTYVYRVGDEVPRLGVPRPRPAGSPNQGLVVAGVIAACLAGLMFIFIPITAAILFPVFSQAREKARSAVCMAHMKQIGLGLSMYADDYDGHLPLAKSWCDGVQTYVRNPVLFQCPNLPDARGAQAYNARLSAVPKTRIATPDQTPAVFDSKAGWNLAGGAELADPRHSEGLNMLFMNGQVDWLRSLDQVVWKPAGKRSKQSESE